MDLTLVDLPGLTKAGDQTSKPGSLEKSWNWTTCFVGPFSEPWTIKKWDLSSIWGYHWNIIEISHLNPLVLHATCQVPTADQPKDMPQKIRRPGRLRGLFFLFIVAPPFLISPARRLHACHISLSLSLHHWHHLHTLHCLTPHVAAAITQGLGEDVCGETQQHHLSRLCCQRWLGYLWCTGLGTRSGSSRLAHRDLTEKIQRDLRFALWCFRDRPQIQQFRDWTKNAVTIWEGMTLMLQLSIYHVSIIYCHVYDWKEEPLVVWLFFGLWFVMFSVIVFWGWSFDQVWLRWCWQCHLGPTGWCISTSFGLHRSGLQDDAVRFLGSQWTQVKHGSSQICFKCVSRDITILLMERSEAASQAGLTFEEALKVNSGCELKIVANSRKAQEIMAKV